MRADVTCLQTLPNIGIIAGQEDGYIDILSPYYDSVLVQERHPFCDKILHLEKTSRTGVCELAVVTAGQIYFATIELSEDQEGLGLGRPTKVVFELDELYIDDGAQITGLHEFEPEKFIALTWWTNKIYIFKRSTYYLMNAGQADKANT